MELRQAGYLIKTRREKYNFSQNAVAKESSIGRPTLSLLENGKIPTDMGYSKVQRVLSVLGVEFPDLKQAGKMIRAQRDMLGVSQDAVIERVAALARQERTERGEQCSDDDPKMGRPTLSLLETGSLTGDIGFNKVCRIFRALGTEIDYEEHPPKLTEKRSRRRAAA